MTKDQQIIFKKLRSVILCLTAHPDNEPESEFADRIEDLEQIVNFDLFRLIMGYNKLLSWKESMNIIHNDLNLQGVGSALGCELGSNISQQVLPKIKLLLTERDELLEMLREVTTQLELKLGYESNLIKASRLLISQSQKGGSYGK